MFVYIWYMYIYIYICIYMYICIYIWISLYIFAITIYVYVYTCVVCNVYMSIWIRSLVMKNKAAFFSIPLRSVRYFALAHERCVLYIYIYIYIYIDICMCMYMCIQGYLGFWSMDYTPAVTAPAPVVTSGLVGGMHMCMQV